jgi:serine/threonine-protein kinase
LKGDYSGAESALRKAISIDPQIDGCHYYIGLMQLTRGQPKEALKEFLADPDIAARDGGTALVSQALGKRAESDAALARVISERGKTWPFNVARIHAYRGEKDQAFDWLEKAYVARDVELDFVLRDPYLVPLHDDPRWSALMKKMNLPE